MWQVTPTSSPQSEATADLVHRLRDDVLVDGEAALGSEIAVTGAGPGSVDAATFFGDRMPYFFVAVLRSEEHTSELQSLMRTSYAVFCLKKKTTHSNHIIIKTYTTERNYIECQDTPIEP